MILKLDKAIDNQDLYTLVKDASRATRTMEIIGNVKDIEFNYDLTTKQYKLLDEYCDAVYKEHLNEPLDYLLAELHEALAL